MQEEIGKTAGAIPLAILVGFSIAIREAFSDDIFAVGTRIILRAPSDTTAASERAVIGSSFQKC